MSGALRGGEECRAGLAAPIPHGLARASVLALVLESRQHHCRAVLACNRPPSLALRPLLNQEGSRTNKLPSLAKEGRRVRAGGWSE